MKRIDLTEAIVLYGPQGEAVSAVPRDYTVFEGRHPGSGIPLQPQHPHGAIPRQWVPFSGWNLSFIPRREYRTLTPFETLHALADNCDLLRIAIEDYKGQLQGLSWKIQAKKDESENQDTAITELTEALRCPDGDHDFQTWLGMFIEEMMVTDAVSMYRLRRLDGSPLGLQLLDGSTIKPIVDFRGIAPPPPEVAYQQITYGRVESEYTKRWGDADPKEPNGDNKVELIYAPRWKRTRAPYGQSPVERVIMTINIALRRQLHYLAFYTTGNMPDAFWKTPKEWTGNQIVAYQEIWDEMIAGESEQRAGKIRFMPGGEGTGLEDPRGHHEWTYEFDEWLARIIAWCIGVSPLPVAKMMNRATSEQADLGETDSSLKPAMKFIKTFIDRELREFFGRNGVEFMWGDVKEVDKRLEFEKNVAYVEARIFTRDEVREEEGREPLSDEQKDELDAMDAASLPRPTYYSRGARGRTTVIDGKVEHELKRWRKHAIRDAQSGRCRSFETEVVPDEMRTALREWIGHATTVEDVAWGFRSLVRARRPLLRARRRIALERAVRAAAAKHLKSRASAVADVIVRAFKRQASRAKVPSDRAIDDAMQWDVFAEVMEGPIGDAYREGAETAGDLRDLETTFALTDEQVIEYARKRSAELIGKRVTADGTVIDNPSAKWAVSDSTRDQLRAKITRALEDGWTAEELRDAIEGGEIWDWRADMIARTEVAVSVNEGALDSYGDAAVEEVDVLDGPGCLADGHDDAQRGVSGQRWKREKARQFPVGHPNCRRDFAPVIAR